MLGSSTARTRPGGAAGRRAPGPRHTASDHVLASKAHFVVRVSRTLRVPDTDHRGVLAVVQLDKQPFSERD